MKFGAQVTVYQNDWDSIRGVVELLDAGLWDSVWFADHYLPPGLRDHHHSKTSEKGA